MRFGGTNSMNNVYIAMKATIMVKYSEYLYVIAWINTRRFQWQQTFSENTWMSFRYRRRIWCTHNSHYVYEVVNPQIPPVNAWKDMHLQHLRISDFFEGRRNRNNFGDWTKLPYKWTRIIALLCPRPSILAVQDFCILTHSRFFQQFTLHQARAHGQA